MKVFKKIFDFLASFELLFILLILITIAMAIGTVLPQQDEPEKYISYWGRVETPEQAPQQSMMPSEEKEPEIDRAKGERIYNRFRSLGFLNLYHSAWFLVLSYLLCLNVALCAIKRRAKLKLFAFNLRRAALPSWEKRKFPIPLSWVEEKPITLVETYLLLSARLRRNGFRIIKGESSLDASKPETNGKRVPSMEKVAIVASKGFPQTFLSVIFHISMILALVFCGLGSLSAFETLILLEKDVVVDDWLNRGELASRTLNGELVGLPPSLSMTEPVVMPLPDSMKETISPTDALSKIKTADQDFISKVTSAHYSMSSNPFRIDHFDRLVKYKDFCRVMLSDFNTEYVEYKFKPSPKDWFPTIQFLNDSGTKLYEWVAESNHPAKFSGVQYHISDYLYKFQLIVESPDSSQFVLPSAPPDGKGFSGYLSRKAYGWQPEKIKIDEIGAELTVKNIYTGKLFKTERAKESSDIKPYVDIQAKPLEEMSSMSMTTPVMDEAQTAMGMEETSNKESSEKADNSSMNDGGMMPQPPEYVKLRTREGYVEAGEKPVNVNGYNLYLGDLNPIVEFGVRHDPGIIWFYFFGYLACLVMALKIYYPSYRLQVTIESHEKERVVMKFSLIGWGLFSNVNSIRKNIELPKDIN